jgi:hypothetical protein
MKRQSILLNLGLFLVFISLMIYLVTLLQGNADITASQVETSDPFSKFLPFVLFFAPGYCMICLYGLGEPSEFEREPVAGRRRGLLLTGYLVLSLVINLFFLVVYMVGAPTAQSALSYPVWAPPLFILCGAANALFTLAIWNWRRWALWGLAIAALVTLLVSLGAGIPIYLAWVQAAGVLLLGLLVRPKWKFMM